MARPSRWEWALAAAVLAAAVPFGALVIDRTALIDRPTGDLGVYLRAAWAVHADPDHLYDHTDWNGWHYCYPPLFAILLTPVGEPPIPPAADGVRLAVAAGVFYSVSVLCLLAGVHVLAGALELGSPKRAPFGSRHWLWLRLLPLFVCLPPIGHTLARGQTNLILLLCLCCGMAAVVHGRRFVGGAALSGLACLKIFPAYLVLYPLWRRDGRVAAGWAAGLAVGLVGIPALVMGPARTLGCYEKLAVVLVGPALHLNHDESRAKELIETTATDSQSFLAVIHNTLHLNVDRLHRPPEAAAAVRWAHFALAGLFTLLTLAAASRRRVEDPAGVVLFLGALALVMIVSSPVCHTHYFALSLPLVMALVAREWDRAGGLRLRKSLWVLLAAQLVGNTLPLIGGLEVFKDAGLALYAALALWATACISLWRGAPFVQALVSKPLAAKAA